MMKEFSLEKHILKSLSYDMGIENVLVSRIKRGGYTC